MMKAAGFTPAFSNADGGGAGRGKRADFTRTGFPPSSALFWGLGGMQIFFQIGPFPVFFML